MDPYDCLEIGGTKRPFFIVSVVREKGGANMSHLPLYINTDCFKCFLQNGCKYKLLKFKHYMECGQGNRGNV